MQMASRKNTRRVSTFQDGLNQRQPFGCRKLAVLEGTATGVSSDAGLPFTFPHAASTVRGRLLRLLQAPDVPLGGDAVLAAHLDVVAAAHLHAGRQPPDEARPTAGRARVAGRHERLAADDLHVRRQLLHEERLHGASRHRRRRRRAGGLRRSQETV